MISYLAAMLQGIEGLVEFEYYFVFHITGDQSKNAAHFGDRGMSVSRCRRVK